MSKEDAGIIGTQKAAIRKEILKKRRMLSDEECMRRSKIICETFLEKSLYRDAKTILLYKAYNNEVNTDMIFERAIADGKTVAYPVSAMMDGEPVMTFYITDDLQTLREGYKTIPEPDPDMSLGAFEGRADVCIVPGAAFDRKCHRIGYGKAFYDRYIRLYEPAIVAGLAYSDQIVDDFETEDCDRPADLVITESGIYYR